MSDDNKVLSQEEIDAMLSGGASGNAEASGQQEAAPPAGASPAPASPQPTAAPPPAPATPVPDTTQEIINRMAERLETLGAAMERITQLERALTETNAAFRQIHQDFQAMAGQVQLVSSRVEGILDNLKATLGYRAQKTFTCPSCSSHGEVAAQIKCTHCGQQNWWGWWPGDKRS